MRRSRSPRRCTPKSLLEARDWPDHLKSRRPGGPLRGKGKRGGARVIYYYHDLDMPILLITMYPKSAKRDLSQAEKNELKKLMPVLVSIYKSRRKGKR